jgi:hypothetical protein
MSVLSLTMLTGKVPLPDLGVLDRHNYNKLVAAKALGNQLAVALPLDREISRHGAWLFLFGVPKGWSYFGVDGGFARFIFAHGDASAVGFVELRRYGLAGFQVCGFLCGGLRVGSPNR